MTSTFECSKKWGDYPGCYKFISCLSFNLIYLVMLLLCGNNDVFREVMYLFITIGKKPLFGGRHYAIVYF